MKASVDHGQVDRQYKRAWIRPTRHARDFLSQVSLHKRYFLGGRRDLKWLVVGNDGDDADDLHHLGSHSQD